MNWHAISVEEVSSALDTDLAGGLSEPEVQRRLKEQGPNRLPRELTFNRTKIFVSQFLNPLILTLIAAGAITIYLGDLSDTIIIFATVALNAAFGYFQEAKTSKIMDALRNVVQTKAFVKREGHEKEVSQESLVSGDIMILAAGAKVPADARLIYANDLKVNESSLTGEWLPVDKDTMPVEENASMAERRSVVHMGTIIESGEGEAIVVETGSRTEIGKIAEATKKTKEEKTPYQKKLDKFSKLVGILLVALIMILFVDGIISGNDPKEMFLVSVAVAVAAIPEGLPTAMSVILAVGSQQILKKKGLVKRLASAETLGSTNVILMDKTGTLTQAKMELSAIFAGDRLFNGEGERPEGRVSAPAESALKSAVLSSEAFVENLDKPVEKWVVRGRPTERAIVEAGIRTGLIKEEIEKKEPKVTELTFSAEWRYSAVLHDDPDNGLVVYSMGAPEVMIDKSSKMEHDGKVRRLTHEEKIMLMKKANDLSAGGARVLATARKSIAGEHKKLSRDISDLVFTGFLVFSDPIRGEVRRALESCRRASIRPIIVTGDNPLTAKAIANSLGFEASEENIMDGVELERISDEELAGRIEDIKIFARVAPTQKLRIVSAWQKKKQVVAMAGDGVNDAPAIKKADVGIALGSGTDAAKEAADFLLLDDSFVVIETAIEEGRRILDNIRKVITYLLSDSFTETLLVGTAITLGLPIPVTAAQILWVNLIEDGLPSIALAFEPKEKDVMSRTPNGKEGLLNREMKVIIFVIGIVTDLILITMFLSLSARPIGIETVRTVVFALLAINSIFYSFSCKNLRKNIWETDILSNKLLIFASIFGFTALVTAIYVPQLNSLLGTVPIPFSFWPMILGLAAANVILIESAKFYFIKRKLTE